MQGELRSGRGLRMRNRTYLAYMYTRSSIAVCMIALQHFYINVKCATKLDFEV